MKSDIVVAVVLYLGLLAFYRWNEPKARARDKQLQYKQLQDKREQQWRQQDSKPGK